jgi:hypothetical protein
MAACLRTITDRSRRVLLLIFLPFDDIFYNIHDED